MKLGKKPPRLDARTLRLADYMQHDGLGIPPLSADFSQGVTEWGQMRNDYVGDCTCAAAGHLLMLWGAANKAPFVPSDDAILAAYSAITGYKPDDETTDHGAVELDVLNFWRQTGIAGHKIAAYAALTPVNTDEIKWAVQLFGGCYTGFALPLAAQGKDFWDCELPLPTGALNWQWAPGSWGGHAVPIVAYDDAGVTVITWGQRLKACWDFVEAYCEEAYAIIAPDWDPAATIAPNGLDLQTLQNDLQKIDQGGA